MAGELAGASRVVLTEAMATTEESVVREEAMAGTTAGWAWLVAVAEVVAWAVVASMVAAKHSTLDIHDNSRTSCT